MTIWDRVRAALAPVPALDLTAPVDAGFAIDTSSIDPALFGLAAYDTGTFYGTVARVSRVQAVTVPAVKRARDLIAGTIGQLPAYALDPKNQRVARQLLTQPERAVPRSVTMARTVEDMLFEGVAWWRITGFGWDGRPAEVVRLDPRTVDVREDSKVYVRADGTNQGTAYYFTPDDLLIRFDSPNDPLLTAAARAIRTCLKLEAAADRYADSPQAREYFSPLEGADPVDDDEILDLLAAWKTARQTGVTGYVPAALKLNQVNAWSPADLQLAEARQHAALEVSRATGIDPEDLGVSTTSRTYSNMIDRRMWLQDMVLGPYVSAIQDRLSMDDVTPRGYRVRLDFAGFTRSSEADRYDTYAKGKALGVLDDAEIARREERPEPTAPAAAPDPAPDQTQEPDMVPTTATAAPAATFARTLPASVEFDADDVDSFRVDPHARTISGLVVPYGAVAHKAGRRFRFAAGSLKFTAPRRVKLLRDHDQSQAVGVLVKATELPTGMFATFKVARGAAGDAVLALVEDGVLDGLSVGVDFAADGVQEDRDGVHVVTAAAWRETSLTAVPAFDDARVTDVAASDHPKENFAMEPDATPGTPAPAPVAPAPAAAPVVDTAALAADLAVHFAAHDPRPVIPAGAPLVSVREEAPYRFNGGPGRHDFSSDVIGALRDRDGDALSRVMAFMGESFAVTTTSVDELNPSRQRPDMYVDQLDYDTPIWTAINKGTVNDNTPFILPKFNSAGSLVADHTEGTEPGAGSFTTTSQTITPAPVSGRVEITREVWDQGGNPQLSGLLWRQFTRAYNEALEAKAVTLLKGITPGATYTITTGAADSALATEVEAKFAALHYVRGGNRMRDLFLQIDLYTAMINATSTDGRKLYPVLGASNASGTVANDFGSIEIAGRRARPAWALDATGTTATKSFLFDREDVHGWASAPKRLDFEYRVAYVDLALWGYVATACTRTDGVRVFSYDPV